MRRLLPGLLALLALCAQAQSIDGAEDVNEQERQETRDLFRPSFKRLTQLDESDRGRDGRYGWDRDVQVRLMIPLSFKRSVASAVSCMADLTVIATARTSRTFLAADEMNIVTRTTFQVDEVLRSRGDTGHPASLRVYLNRGELNIAGKIVYIGRPAIPDFIEGEQYVLLMQRRGQHFLLTQGAGAIRSGQVFYPEGAWKNVESGTALEDVSAQLRARHEQDCM